MQEQELLLKLLGLLDQLVAERGVPQETSEVDKQIIKSPNSTLDNGKKPKSNITTQEKKRLTETFNLFNRMFFEYQKKQQPDSKEKTKVSGLAAQQAKGQAPKGAEKAGSLLMTVLGGLLLLAGGIAAFVKGVMSNGPFKGILKLLSKVGLKGGIELLMKAVKPFLKIAEKILFYPLKFIKVIVEFLGKGFARVGKFIGEGVGKLAGKVLGKVGIKIGGGGLMKMAGKFLGFVGKALKKLPIIGTLISLGFAWSRFSSGDVVGGTIDVLSGLAAMIPVVGTAVSIGLDVLNAVLDVKADQGPGKPPKSKIDIMKDMVAPIGEWIWENRKYIPILSAVDRFMLSWDEFSKGNILAGIENFGYAMMNLIPGQPGEMVAEGISAFMGLFEEKPQADGSIKPSKGFISEMVDSISKAMVGLWDWLKNYVKEAVKAYLTGGLWGAAEKVGGDIKNVAVKAYDETSKFVSNAWDSTVAKTKEIGSSMVGWAKGTFDKGVGYVKDMFKSAKDTVTDALTPDVKKGPKLDSLAMLGDTILKMLGEDTPEVGGGVGGASSPEHSGVGGMLSQGEATKSVSEMMYDLQVQANQYLAMIVNNTARMTGASGAGPASTVMMSPQMGPQSNPKVEVPTNRAGYPSSVYALG